MNRRASWIVGTGTPTGVAVRSRVAVTMSPRRPMLDFTLSFFNPINRNFVIYTSSLIATPTFRTFLLKNVSLMTIPDCPIVQSAVRVRDETRRDETRRDDARHGATRAMTRASPRKRASENDREAANATRRRPVPPRGRAPPLTPSDIEALNKAGKKRVLARWGARTRGLKRRLSALSEQYPTSSFILLFTKPVLTECRRTGVWCAL